MRLATLTLGLVMVVCVMDLTAVEKSKPRTHTVTIEGMRFQPDALTVSRGDTIVWVNKDLVPHTATSKAGNFDSKTIQVDKSWKYAMPTKGTFAYICTLHPTMKGTLRVR